MFTVFIHLKSQSQPVEYANVINAYEKGSFYCVYCNDGFVYKHPIQDIWRVKETYGKLRDDAKLKNAMGS